MSIEDQARSLTSTLERLTEQLSSLSFAAPVTHVLNPLEYAKEPVSLYLRRYLCGPPGRTLLLGMNPGPWGMAQTGVPFGEVEMVRDYLSISAPVSQPPRAHPKRPVQGFECRRSEVSGRRLWGFFQQHFPNARDFAQRYVVFNYCPLIFMEESGRNRTPDKLSKKERDKLFEICDAALAEVLGTLQIGRAFGVGKFAETRLKSVAGAALGPRRIDSILHPSPASPAANRGWAQAVAHKLLSVPEPSLASKPSTNS